MIKLEKASRSLYMFVISAVFVVIVLLPFAATLVRSTWNEGAFSLQAYRKILLDSGQLRLLLNTLCISLGTTITACVLGTVVGVLTEYARIPYRRTLLYVVAASFLMPPYVTTLAWIDLLGNNGRLRAFLTEGCGVAIPSIYGSWGVILVLSLSYYPISVLAAVICIRRLDRRLEEAALLFYGESRVFFSIVLPLLAPGIAAGALIVFVTTLLGFSVPSLLQVHVFSVESFDRYSAFSDLSGAVALGMPTLLIGILAVFAWLRYMRPRQGWLTGSRRPRTETNALPIVGVLGSLFCWTLVLVSAILPMAVIVVGSLPLRTFVEVFLTAKEEILTSLLVAAISATVITWTSFSLAALFARRRSTILVNVGSLLPFLMSGTILGVGLIFLWNRTGLPAMVYDSMAIVVIASTARFMFLANGCLSTALRDLHPGIREAARVCGVSWRRELTGIVFPLCRPAVVATWGLCFIFSLTEIEASVLLCPPGFTTLPVRLFSLMHYGPGAYVSALSVLTVAIVLTIAGATTIIYLWSKERIDERR